MGALKDNGHALTKIELDKLFRYFDKNGDDKVCYTTLLKCVRGGECPPCFMGLLKKCWANMSGGKDTVSLCDQMKFGKAAAERLQAEDPIMFNHMGKMVCA